MDIQNLDNLEVELPPEYENLPVFVVGGAVRDAIRGMEPTDVDLMVAEVTPEEMRDRGFKEINSPNNDTFGVFQDSLHREVAIAREDVSTGTSHTDVNVKMIDPSVSAGEALHRDLERRDFTVNAIALDARWGVLHDPHGGQEDLREGVIRAVSDSSFVEDPLRILRGARFAARLDADIEDRSLEDMRSAVHLLSDLPNERIRIELEKALKQADKPSQFFEWLEEVDALEKTFPELQALKDVPAGPEEFHGEGSAFKHTMMVLDEMSNRHPEDELSMLMAIAHDIGKATTNRSDLPGHPGHGKRGVPIIEEMSDRLAFSNRQKNAMKEAALHHMKFRDIDEMRETTIIDLFLQTDELPRLIALAHADSEGRVPKEGWDDGAAILRLAAAREACEEWTGQRLIEEGYDPSEMGGENFGNLVRQKRVERMRELEQ